MVPRANGEVGHRPPTHPRGLLHPHAQRITRSHTQCTGAAAGPAPGGRRRRTPPEECNWDPPTATNDCMPHRLTRRHLPHDYHATNDSRGHHTLPLQWASLEGTFTWGEILPGTVALTYLWLQDAETHAQPPGTHLLLTLEGEAAVENVHTAEGEDYVTANADTAVWLHAHEHTTPPTVVPGSHPWHVVIVRLPTGADTGSAQQGWADRWVHVCASLHEGLHRPSLTSHTLEPVPTTAESHTGATPPTGVWAYTRILHREAAEALKTAISNHQGLVHTPHDNTQKGYTLWWHHPAPEGGLQPPADQPGISPDLTAIAHTVAAMAQQVGAPPQWAPSIIKETAAGHNPAFAHFRGRPIHLTLPDLDLPADDARAVDILVPHDTAPKTGKATARITKQLPNTALHYDIPTPNVIVTHNTGRDHYYLQATHERSPVTIYTLTTYPGLQPPQHHPRPAWKHPLHVAPTLRKRPIPHAPPPADSTALHTARRRAAAHHQNHLLPRINAGPGTVTEATHKSTLNLLARKLRPKMALEDTLWIYYGESRTARVADLRTIMPRHIQRAVGPFTVYAVPHPITAQCTHCNPRCALPCAGALQQPLPTPTYRGGIYLGTIPGDPHPYLLPAADRHHAIPLHLVEQLAVGPSPFQKRPPHTPSDGRPPDEPTHATPGPKRAIALLTLKAEATIPRDLEGENHLMVERLTEHVLIAAMYATASASRLWEDRPSPPLAKQRRTPPTQALPPRTSTKSSTCEQPRRPTLRSAPSGSSAGTPWTPPRPPRRSTSSNTGTPGRRWNGTTTARSDGQRHAPPTTKSRPHHAEGTACDSPQASPTPQKQPGKRCTTPSTGHRGRQKAPSPLNAPQREHATPPATRPTCAATGQAPGTGSSPGPQTRPTPCRRPRKCLAS